MYRGFEPAAGSGRDAEIIIGGSVLQLNPTSSLRLRVMEVGSQRAERGSR